MPPQPSVGGVMRSINSQNIGSIRICLKNYRVWIQDNVTGPVGREVGFQPEKLTTIDNDLTQIMKNVSLSSNVDKIPIDSIDAAGLSYLKQAIIHRIRALSSDVEIKSARTNNPKLRDHLDAELRSYSNLTNGDWFDRTTAFSTPRLTDFLTIQRAEHILLENDNWPVQREYDEKFHILNSPMLFWGDVKHYRAACELRGKQISIAFLDIDNFKGFNDTHGEMTVDRDLLPKFMSELEAHVFSHGHAYRQGGDEYIVLLPNTAGSRARDFLGEFQTRLKEVDYHGIDQGPTVSIGIFAVGQECALTDKECLKMAEDAKREAKKKGKDKIVLNVGASAGINSFDE